MSHSYRKSEIVVAAFFVAVLVVSAWFDAQLDLGLWQVWSVLALAFALFFAVQAGKQKGGVPPHGGNGAPAAPAPPFTPSEDWHGPQRKCD